MAEPGAHLGLTSNLGSCETGPLQAAAEAETPIQSKAEVICARVAPRDCQMTNLLLSAACCCSGSEGGAAASRLAAHDRPSRGFPHRLLSRGCNNN